MRKRNLYIITIVGVVFSLNASAEVLIPAEMCTTLALATDKAASSNANYMNTVGSLPLHLIREKFSGPDGELMDKLATDKAAYEAAGKQFQSSLQDLAYRLKRCARGR